MIASRSGPRKETMLEWNWDEGRATELNRAAMNARLNTRNNPTPGTQDNEGLS